MYAAAINSALLLFFTTLTIFITFGTRMGAEGLPIMEQEHGNDDRGLIAGRDFLSILTSISNSDPTWKRVRTEPTTEFNSDAITTDSSQTQTSLHREIRSTLNYAATNVNSDQESNFNYKPTTSAQYKLGNHKTSDNNLDEGVIVAVRVSSSIGRTLINKQNEEHQMISDVNVVEDTTFSQFTTESYSSDVIDQNFVASEEHPSIVAAASKSELSVEEREPITSNSDLVQSAYPRRFSPNLHAQVGPQNTPSYNSDTVYLPTQISIENTKTKLHPYQTVVYHNQGERHQARSVSYSTVIQSVPHIDSDKNWDNDNHTPHERQERHYDIGKTANLVNNFEINGDILKINGTNQYAPQQNSQYFRTHDSPFKENKWEKPEEAYVAPSTAKPEPPEKTWQHPEKQYSPTERYRIPYSKPEQNYEVDEAVSVHSNGRIHGVQAGQEPKDDSKANEASKKTDDNQKVGYVVEGRNYRKYRVEERTSDGFIVGEYGVVSHNDGSLRGVRYTADGTTNPRLIYDALMKFLSL